MRHTLRLIITCTIVCILSIVSCTKKDMDSDRTRPTEDCEKGITIDPDTFAAATSDPYELISAIIENHELHMTLSYGGGCGTVDYDLLTDGSFIESFPVQLLVFLSFKDDDTCKALVQEDVCIDLIGLVSHFAFSYQTAQGTIILHLDGHDEPLELKF